MVLELVNCKTQIQTRLGPDVRSLITTIPRGFTDYSYPGLVSSSKSSSYLSGYGPAPLRSCIGHGTRLIDNCGLVFHFRMAVRTRALA